jgi:DNA-binding GntR family transcriptional regulator
VRPEGGAVNVFEDNLLEKPPMTRAPYLDLSARLPGPPEQARGLPDFVAARLREAILSGMIEAEALLRQEDIGQRFGVSRPPVREALRQLEAEGLVVSRPRRGYVVARLDAAEIAEIFDIRMVLEAQAAEHAALKRTEEDLRAMEELVVRMEQIRIETAEDGRHFSLLNREFHARICAAGGRRFSGQVLLTLRNQVERYVRLGSALIGNMDRVTSEHREILEACRAGDPGRMAALSLRHVQETGRRLLAELSHAAHRGKEGRGERRSRE